MSLIAPLLSAIAPYMLWPIEQILPYPFIVEELGKFAIVLIIFRDIQDKRSGIILAFFSGVFFALSESVLYLFNIYAGAGLSLLFLRLLLTIPLHTLTFLLIAAGRFKNKRWASLGLILAILIHFLYNLVVRSLT